MGRARSFLLRKLRHNLDVPESTGHRRTGRSRLQLPLSRCDSALGSHLDRGSIAVDSTSRRLATICAHQKQEMILVRCVLAQWPWERKLSELSLSAH